VGAEENSATWITYLEGRPTRLCVRRYRLEVIAGPNAGEKAELDGELIRVGARPGCDLRLSDQKVSGFHFEIAVEDGGYRLHDLESTNGTFLGGFRVNDAFLHARAVIQLGDTAIRFTPLDEYTEVELSNDGQLGELIGRSARMRDVFARLERLAATDATLLITGETGTGKELAAHAVHQRSRRTNKPFVVVDCGSMASGLVESELFGHERGAFTGALRQHIGAFERAQGGTLFLDEIGELPLDLQPKLLRAIERREIRRVGGSAEISVDIRLIAATHRNLPADVNRRLFREDLYYRIAVAGVHLPALRERREDIPDLIAHFLASIPGAAESAFPSAAMEQAKKGEWPGNVRELRNFVERTVFTGLGELGSMGAEDDERSPADASAIELAIDTRVPFKLAKQRHIDAFERAFLRALLDEHRGNISAAARASGIDRMTIHKMLHRLGLDSRAPYFR
jgi:transcriptional regulator with GAF, ATPase, and Fis domain